MDAILAAAAGASHRFLSAAVITRGAPKKEHVRVTFQDGANGPSARQWRGDVGPSARHLAGSGGRTGGRGHHQSEKAEGAGGRAFLSLLPTWALWKCRLGMEHQVDVFELSTVASLKLLCFIVSYRELGRVCVPCRYRHTFRQQPDLPRFQGPSLK